MKGKKGVEMGGGCLNAIKWEKAYTNKRINKKKINK